MAFNYTYANFRALVRDGAGQKGSNLTDERGTLNRAVRSVVADVDLRSLIRRSILSPRVTEEYDYTAPSNMKSWGLIDIQKVSERPTWQSGEFILTTPEEFDRMKTLYPNICAVLDFDGQKILRVAADIDDDRLIIHSMDGVTSNGTWSADSDNTAANDLDTSSTNTYTGSANLVWDVDTTGTSATIQNSTMTAVDISDFKRDGGYIFLKQYVPVSSASERAKMTSFRLQFGSDSNNYYQDTATLNNEGITFREGLNTLRFNLPTSAAAGTPSDTAIDYVRLGLVLSSAFTDEIKGWRTDAIVARQGQIHNALYYTDFPWDCGALRVSASDTDYLSVAEDEFDLMVEKGIEYVARATGDKDRSKEAREEYVRKKDSYLMQSPSRAMIPQTTYHRFENEETVNSNIYDS